jgi:hypothetical protein
MDEANICIHIPADARGQPCINKANSKLFHKKQGQMESVNCFHRMEQQFISINGFEKENGEP